jgi:hypothetical protein
LRRHFDISIIAASLGEQLMFGRSRRVLVLSTLSTLAAGCLVAVAGAGCARFAPAMPMRSQTGDVALTMRHMRLGLGQDMTFESRTTTPHKIQRGWLTVATRDPCSGGAEVMDVIVDDGRGAPGALPPGTHDLRVTFHDSLADYSLDVVLDLAIDDDQCVRVPAVSQSIGFTSEQRVTPVVSSMLWGNNDVGGLRGVFGVQAGVAAWLGPVQAAAQIGVGQSLCETSACGEKQGGGLHGGVAIPVSLDARVPFASGIRHHIASVGAAGARYAFTSVGLPGLDGNRRFGVHSFQGVLSWGFGDSLTGPFRHLERALPFEVLFPIGVLFAPDAPGARVAFGAGIELRLNFHL